MDALQGHTTNAADFGENYHSFRWFPTTGRSAATLAIGVSASGKFGSIRSRVFGWHPPFGWGWGGSAWAAVVRWHGLGAVGRLRTVPTGSSGGARIWLYAKAEDRVTPCGHRGRGEVGRHRCAQRRSPERRYGSGGRARPRRVTIGSPVWALGQWVGRSAADRDAVRRGHGVAAFFLRSESPLSSSL